MEKEIDYKKVYLNLTKNLSPREKKIISERFGLNNNGVSRTLQSIGEDIGISRERVRQIIERSFSKIIKENSEILKKIKKIFLNYFKNEGSIKRQDIVLKDLTKNKSEQGYVKFFLNLIDGFYFIFQKREYFSFWSTKNFSQKEINKILSKIKRLLAREKKPLNLESLSLKLKGIDKKFLKSILEISKEIGKTKEGLYGLNTWPEIKPRGIKDKAYLVFKKEKRPLHFRDVAKLISPDCVVETVHNELIKDKRVVLVGRGIYALKEWGYKPGTVRDVVLDILKKEKKPISKDEIIKRTLKQRIVEKSTILIALSDKKLFQRDEKGNYKLKTELI